MLGPTGPPTDDFHLTHEHSEGCLIRDGPKAPIYTMMKSKSHKKSASDDYRRLYEVLMKKPMDSDAQFCFPYLPGYEILVGRLRQNAIPASIDMAADINQDFNLNMNAEQLQRLSKLLETGFTHRLHIDENSRGLLAQDLNQAFQDGFRPSRNMALSTPQSPQRTLPKTEVEQEDSTRVTTSTSSISSRQSEKILADVTSLGLSGFENVDLQEEFSEETLQNWEGVNMDDMEYFNGALMATDTSAAR
ncbi:hypothetical protein BROUX41_004224 [Berkeleyomyces rouxiae]|uniref:uncharacterized protein n=1 Tax=Berkeleyomyces rouxiae TaxID=2035830 RepID=UPI003B7EC010